jgi:hypothetical protein
VLLDFDAVAIGPREWDLMSTSIAVQRYGLPEEQYQEFAANYGFDVRSWPGYPVLQRGAAGGDVPSRRGRAAGHLGDRSKSLGDLGVKGEGHDGSPCERAMYSG